MENWPSVTAFTLVYNTGRHVVQALESVKANRYPNLQHIIIDDCSPDGVSADLVEKWISDNDYLCTFIRHQTNQGICKSLNEVLRLTSGKYTFGISDDLIAPDRIKTQVLELEVAGDEYAAVYADCYVIDENGERLPHTCYEMHERNINSFPSGECFKEMISNFFIITPSIMARTSCYRDVGGYDENLLIEDIDIFCRLSSKYKFLKSDKITVYYRSHPNAMSSSKGHLYYRSILLSYMKLLGISDDTDIAIKEKLIRYSKLYFFSQPPKPWQLLGKTASVSGSRETWLIYFLSKLRVPMRLVNFLNELKPSKTGSKKS